MKYLISVFVFFVLQSERPFAQNSYTILFKTYKLLPDSTLFGAGSDMFLSIKDSLSYTYYPSYNHKDTVTYPLGSSLIPKSAFVNVNCRLVIFPYGYKDEPKTYALLIGEFPSEKWKITDERKVILGDTCIKATSKLNGQETIAYYSPKLPAGFGIYSTVGLPGTILEIYTPERNLLTRAESIIESSPEIIEPVFARKVLFKTYLERRRITGSPKIKWREKDFIN